MQVPWRTAKPHTLDQRTIHKNLHFTNSITHSLTHSLARLFRQLAMAPGVIFEIEIASPAGVIVKHWTHSCFEQQVAVWLRSQRVSAALWDSELSRTDSGSDLGYPSPTEVYDS
jgi:hypothetical protein